MNQSEMDFMDQRTVSFCFSVGVVLVIFRLKLNINVIYYNNNDHHLRKAIR